MPFAIKAELTGLGEVLGRLRAVDAKVRKQLLRRALGEAGKIVLRGARARVPKDTGLLKRSLGRKTKTYRQSGTVVVIVGPRTGFAENVARGRGAILANPTRYAHLVELGTRHSPARPFLRPAFDESKGSILDVITNVITNGIEDAAKQ